MRYLFEDYVLDIDRRELCRGTDVVPIAPQVFDLLEYLIRNRERVVSKDDLIDAVWKGRSVSDAAVTTRLNAARSTLGDSGEAQRLIKTVPRKGFRFVGTVREEQAHRPVGEASIEGHRAAPTLPDKPSIAILPFVNLNADPEQEYFADGMWETSSPSCHASPSCSSSPAIRASSTRAKRSMSGWLGVSWVCDTCWGSVRRSENRLRISAQLIDSAMGAHRWAEHYDRRLEDVFALQDEVVRTIVAILAVHVRKAETERTRAKPPNSLRAYDHYLRAIDAYATFNSSFNVGDLYETRRLLHQSLAVDPNYARSYAVLTLTYGTSWVYPLDGDFLNPAVLDEADRLARKALQLDLNLPQAHACFGNVLTWKGEPDAAIAAFDRAVVLDPNYTDWAFGQALILAGEPRRAIEVLKALMRLDPFYEPMVPAFVGWAHYMLKEYSQAIPLLLECVARAPNFPSGHGLLAATFGQLGRLDEARAEAAEVLRVLPSYTITGTTKRISQYKLAKDAEHVFDGLRKAGLPE